MRDWTCFHPVSGVSVYIVSDISFGIESYAFFPLLICYRPDHMGIFPKVREDNQIAVAWKASVLQWAFPFAFSAALISAFLTCIHVPYEVLCSKHDVYYVFSST